MRLTNLSLFLFVSIALNLISCKEPVDERTLNRTIVNSLPEMVDLFVYSDRDSFNVSIAPRDTLNFSQTCQDLFSGEYCRVGWYADMSTRIVVRFRDGKSNLHVGLSCPSFFGKNINIDELTISENIVNGSDPYCGYRFVALNPNLISALYTIDSLDYSFAR